MLYRDLFAKLFFIIIALIFLIHVDNVDAEIRRWVDKDGKVHYSDKNIHEESAEVVKITDKYTIPIVEVNEPIQYQQVEANRTISIASILLDLPRSTMEDVRIGREACSGAVDYYWTKGVIDLQSKELGKTLTSVFLEAGYAAESGIENISYGGSLVLSGKLKNLKLKICSKKQESDYVKYYTRNSAKKSTRYNDYTKSSSYVEVKWMLYDPILKKELLHFSTKGAHHGLDEAYMKNGAMVAFVRAMEISLKNLLAEKSFVKYLKPENLAELKMDFDNEVKVGFQYGKKEQKINFIFKNLKKNTVTIRTAKGHGSGVLISHDGYVLTNAHVVGDKTEFTVDFGNIKNRKATLIRKEEVRDVALLKINNYPSGFVGVKFSKKLPQVGDEIFVIGTPLRLEFEHTVTKGIVSAERYIAGLPYIQTDAAINPGNSGGPVFDSSGELVALAVAGMFTHEGASLNINYLIPIDDVIKTLKLEAEDFSISSRIKNVASSYLSDKEAVSYLAGSSENNETQKNLSLKIKDDSQEKTLLEIVQEWLNEPVIKLY